MADSPAMPAAPPAAIAHFREHITKWKTDVGTGDTNMSFPEWLKFEMPQLYPEWLKWTQGGK